MSGSTVDWSTDKSSRKNVFQLNTSTDLQMLFQADDTEIAQVRLIIFWNFRSTALNPCLGKIEMLLALPVLLCLFGVTGQLCIGVFPFRSTP